MRPRVPSPIPSRAVERIVQRHENGTRRRSQFLVGEQVIGGRVYDDAGFAYSEWGEKNGQLNGLRLDWYERGILTAATPYRDGLVHGLARQWNREGVLIGRYVMHAGTGWDLWWEENEHGRPFLAEARHYREGVPNGFSWLFSAAGRLINEAHFYGGIEHGVRREWSESGKLRKGHPRCFVDGHKVNHALYEKAARRESKLPPFSKKDDQSQRDYPAPVAQALSGALPTEPPPKSPSGEVNEAVVSTAKPAAKVVSKLQKPAAPKKRSRKKPGSTKRTIQARRAAKNHSSAKPVSKRVPKKATKKVTTTATKKVTTKVNNKSGSRSARKVAKKIAKKAVRKPAKKPIKNPANKPLKKAAKSAANTSAKSATKKASKNATAKTATALSKRAAPRPSKRNRPVERDSSQSPVSRKPKV